MERGNRVISAGNILLSIFAHVGALWPASHGAVPLFRKIAKEETLEEKSWEATSWTPLSPTGEAPKPQSGHAATYCPTDGGGAMIVHGGPGPRGAAPRDKLRRAPSRGHGGLGLGGSAAAGAVSGGARRPGLGAGGRHFGSAWSLARKLAVVAFSLSCRPLASGLPGWVAGGKGLDS